jgi:hypothetical protein
MSVSHGHGDGLVTGEFLHGSQIDTFHYKTLMNVCRRQCHVKPFRRGIFSAASSITNSIPRRDPARHLHRWRSRSPLRLTLETSNEASAG